MDEFIYPNESTYASQVSDFREKGNPWQIVPIVEELKKLPKRKIFGTSFFPRVNMVTV